MLSLEEAISFLHHHKQTSLISHLQSLAPETRVLLLRQLSCLNGCFPEVFHPQKISLPPYEPFTSPCQTQPQLYEIGLQALQSHQALLILLAGGDGSRLGFARPKGCFPILQGKSLFELHFQHIHDLQKKINRQHPVMLLTSPLNTKATLTFLKEHNYFDLPNTRYIEQPLFPVLDENYQWLLKSPAELVLAPNGNGGLFQALSSHKTLLQEVSFIFVLNIDNALAKDFDPELLGGLIHHQADMALRCIPLQKSSHKLGVLAQQKNHLSILDYNDIENIQDFSYGNINILCYRAEFFQTLLNKSWPLHWVKRKTADNRFIWKGEYFITDTLIQSQKPLALLSEERQCFAPLKTLSDVESIQKLLS